MTRAALTSLALLLLLAGCGGEEADPDAPTAPDGPTAPEAPTPGASPPGGGAPKVVRGELSLGEPEESCDEVMDLAIAFGDEALAVGGFELTHTTGFIAGMRYNGKRTAKLVYLVFANYEPRLTRHNLDPPKEEGQVAVMVTFKTESEDVPFQEQVERYMAMEVPTGTYEPGWMDREAIFQVVYYVGGAKAGNGPAISDDGSGEATLTHSTPHLVCGRIDFTSAKGTTIKGTFRVEIERDMWAK